MPSPTAVQKPDERRRKERMNIGKFLLQLDPEDGRMPFSCMIWNISETGVRLKLGDEGKLPSIVTIIVGNVRRKASLVWRKDGDAGFKFLEDEDSSSATDRHLT